MDVTRIEFYTILFGADPSRRQVWLRAGGEYVAQILFWPDEAELPPSSASLLHYHQRDYPSIVDLLRNERPIFVLSMEIDGEVLATITTATESIGENEVRDRLVQGANR